MVLPVERRAGVQRRQDVALLGIAERGEVVRDSAAPELQVRDAVLRLLPRRALRLEAGEVRLELPLLGRERLEFGQERCGGLVVVECCDGATEALLPLPDLGLPSPDRCDIDLDRVGFA